MTREAEGSRVMKYGQYGRGILPQHPSRHRERGLFSSVLLDAPSQLALVSFPICLPGMPRGTRSWKLPAWSSLAPEVLHDVAANLHNRGVEHPRTRQTCNTQVLWDLWETRRISGLLARDSQRTLRWRYKDIFYYILKKTLQ